MRLTSHLDKGTQYTVVASADKSSGPQGHKTNELMRLQPLETARSVRLDPRSARQTQSGLKAWKVLLGCVLAPMTQMIMK